MANPAPKTPASRKPSLFVPLLLGAAVIAITAWFVYPHPAPRADRGGAPAAAAPSEAPRPGLRKAWSPVARGMPPVASSLPPIGLIDDPDRAERAAQARQVLSNYLEFAAFPPWSRPADASQTHLWEWNQLPATGQAFTRDAKGKEISGQLVLDRMFAGPGQVITATVTVWSGSYDGERGAVDAAVAGGLEVFDETARDSRASGRGWVPLEPLAFPGEGGGGPERRFVARFTPSTIPSLAKRNSAKVVAWVSASDHRFPFSQEFRMTAVTPMVVLDRHADKIVDGSLEVTVACDVKILGPILVQASLFDQAGQTPIAIYDDYFRPQQIGPQDLKIIFFGKTIHDKGKDGPYSVRALHGFERMDQQEPPEVFWQSDTPIVTGAYKAADFTSAEWDSPEKAAKVDQYQKLISGIEKGEL